MNLITNKPQKLEGAFEDKEAFSRLIMNNIPQIIFWVNTKLEVQGANRHFLNTYNLSNESEAIGQKIHVFTKDINEKDDTIQKIKEVFQSKNPVYNHHQHFEVDTGRKILQLWVRQNYIPLLNTNKEIMGVLITTVDISQEKIDEAQMQTYNRQLIQSNKELEQFAYIASHDLRSPLTNIISFIDILKKSTATKLNDTELQLMDFITKGAQNMEHLVNAILEFSKINKGSIELEIFSLSELLEVIQSEMKDTLKTQNATLLIKQIPTNIVGDKSQIKQLLENLITNGIKFSKKETNPIIQISCIEDSQYWRFQVKDNGIGIEEEYNQKIFKLFQKLHSASEYKGTGIGLPLCKKIVELHDGEIWVESELGKGSTFYFTIQKLSTVTKQVRMLRNFY